MIEMVKSIDWTTIGPWVVVAFLALATAAGIHTCIDSRRKWEEDNLIPWPPRSDGPLIVPAAHATSAWGQRRAAVDDLPEPPAHKHVYDAVRSDIVICDGGGVLMACMVSGCSVIKTFGPGEFMPIPEVNR